MRDRAVDTGVAVAVAVHLLLLGLLSIAWGKQQPRAWPEPTPMDVSLITEVAPEAQSPAPTPPAQSVAPEVGAPEEAAPVPAPEPQPAPVKPEPAPVTPAPKPAPPKPAPAPKPAPVKPAPVKPAPVKPAPPKTAPAKPTAAAKPAPAKPTTTRSTRLAGLSLGTNPQATATRPRGGRLGDDFRKGLSASASADRRPSAGAPAGKVGAFPAASIAQAIARQIQPCADRQVTTGMPGASRINSVLNISLNPDGTLAATPRMMRQTGVDDENARYKQRVVDLGVAAFKGCSPLRLPAEYYKTASGGWNNISYTWKLR